MADGHGDRVRGVLAELHDVTEAFQTAGDPRAAVRVDHRVLVLGEGGIVADLDRPSRSELARLAEDAKTDTNLMAATLAECDAMIAAGFARGSSVTSGTTEVGVIEPSARAFHDQATLPLAMSAPPMLQPAGSAAMQGSRAADGTAWALRIIEWPVPQAGG